MAAVVQLLADGAVGQAPAFLLQADRISDPGIHAVGADDQVGREAAAVG